MGGKPFGQLRAPGSPISGDVLQPVADLWNYSDGGPCNVALHSGLSYIGAS